MYSCVLTAFNNKRISINQSLFTGHRTCNLQVADLSPGWPPLRSNCTCMSTSSIIWYQSRGSDALRLWKVLGV